MTQTKPPILAWALLVVAVLGVCSAGSLLQQIDLDPLLKASWRLQVTAVVLLPFTLIQWWQLSGELKSKTLEGRTLGILGLSSVALAVHFGAWVSSLKYTTLTHSLLLVTAHPLIVVGGMLFIGMFATGIRQPSRRELSGAIIGFIGATLTLFDEGTQQGHNTATFFGDALAVVGALGIVGYIVCGRILRAWMPIFLYAFPVTLISAVLLLPASMLGEDDFVTYGAVGWMDDTFFGWFLAVALLAGFLGHTGLNTCLKYFPPLMISASTTMEPVIGSLIGYVVFGTSLPGQWTWIGGVVLMVGLMLIVLGVPTDEGTRTQTPEAPEISLAQ